MNKKTGTASIGESVQTLTSMKEAWKPSPVVMRSLDLIAGILYPEVFIFYPVHDRITFYLIFLCSAEGVTYREWAPGALVCSFFCSSNLIACYNTILVPCFNCLIK